MLAKLLTCAFLQKYQCATCRISVLRPDSLPLYAGFLVMTRRVQCDPDSVADLQDEVLAVSCGGEGEFLANLVDDNCQSGAKSKPERLLI